jgi:hypothetical protein
MGLHLNFRFKNYLLIIFLQQFSQQALCNLEHNLRRGSWSHNSLATRNQFERGKFDFDRNIGTSRVTLVNHRIKSQFGQRLQAIFQEFTVIGRRKRSLGRQRFAAN